MNLSSIIEAAVEQSDLDLERAMEIAAAALTDEHRLDLQTRGLAAEISRELHRRRHRMHATALSNREKVQAYEAARLKGAVSAAAGMRLILQDWFAYPLPGGVYLGDADAETLKAAIELYRAQAQYNTSRADFLSAIASRVKRSKTVRQSLSSDEIEQIAQSAGVERREGVPA